MKLGSCILIMIWTLQLQNLQTLTLHGCVEVFALEVTKLPYNESYDTFNEISLFTGNSFKRNPSCFGKSSSPSWPYIGDILLATTRARGSMDSNSLAKGGSLGVDGISLIQMVVFKCNNLVQKFKATTPDHFFLKRVSGLYHLVLGPLF